MKLKELVEFARNQKWAVEASVAASGAPQAAVIGVAVSDSLELVFDTADEGTTGSPKSVRAKTAQIERFVFPTSQTEDGQKQPKPPRRSVTVGQKSRHCGHFARR